MTIESGAFSELIALQVVHLSTKGTMNFELQSFKGLPSLYDIKAEAARVVWSPNMLTRLPSLINIKFVASHIAIAKSFASDCDAMERVQLNSENLPLHLGGSSGGPCLALPRRARIHTDSLLEAGFLARFVDIGLVVTLENDNAALRSWKTYTTLALSPIVKALEAHRLC